MDFKTGQNISVHTYELGVVSGVISKVLENMIIIETKDQESIKVLI